MTFLSNLQWSLELSGRDYTLHLQFNHNNSLPIPKTPDNCNPFKEGGPDLGPDGLPYLAARENLFLLGTGKDSPVSKVIGFQSVSMDWMPCGHPPLGVFTTPHYDMHFYYLNETERNVITCPESPPSPVCYSKQEFFKPLTNNLATGFTLDKDSGVPRSGVHWYDTSLNPISSDQWINPLTIMGSYDGELTFWEIMTPRNFKSKPKYETRVSYTNRTDTRLPNSYRVEWDNQDKITILLQGNLAERITCKGCSHLGGEYRKGYCRIGENYQVLGCPDPSSIWMWITLVVMMMIMLFSLFSCLSTINGKPKNFIGFRETETELSRV